MNSEAFNTNIHENDNDGTEEKNSQNKRSNSDDTLNNLLEDTD